MNILPAKDGWGLVIHQFQQSWSALTEEDLLSVHGRRQLSVGKIQEKYGLSKVQAENALKDWEIQHRNFL